MTHRPIPLVLVSHRREIRCLFCYRRLTYFPNRDVWRHTNSTATAKAA